MRRRALVLIGVILVLSLLLAACGTPSTTTPPTSTTASPTITTRPPVTTTTAPPTTTIKPTATTPPVSPTKDPNKYGGIFKQTLTVGPSTPLGYMPEAANDSYSLAKPAVEALVALKKGGILVPLLATSWTADPAAKTMTFNLRKGVKFHDGTDFNAQAVKWNWDLMMAAKKAPNFKSVEVIDDFTVRVNLNNYQNTDLTGMQSGAFGIISPTSFQKNGLEYTRTHPVGTGPFKFVEYQRDAKLVYTRNDNYWDTGKPYLDGLEYYVVAEETVRKILLQRGDIHRLSAAGITAQELQKAGFSMKSESGGTFGLVPDSNNATSPLADIRVRQAISYAIDREGLASGLGFGFLRPAYQMYPGYATSAIPNLQKTEYNPTKAKQLLKDAGYPTGFKTSIHTFTRLVNRDWVTAIAKMLSDVGIQTAPDFPEAGKYEEYRGQGWTNSLMAHGFMSMDNLNSAFNLYFPQSNIAFPSVKKPAGFYDAVTKSITSPQVDPALLQAAFKLIADDLMVIPYAEQIGVNFYKEGVHDVGADEYALASFISQEAWLEPKAR